MELLCLVVHVGRFVDEVSASETLRFNNHFSEYKMDIFNG